MKTHRLSYITSALALALGLSTSAMAAETSSSMRGKIVGPEGNVASNVIIKLIHGPTGTVNEYVTNENGTFIAKGLRVGGPYRVVIDSDKFNDTQVNNIMLSLGDTYRLNKQLEPLSVERIEVTASRLLQDVGGSNSIFGEDLINNAPSFNRDIKDVARMNPLASINGNGELTFAGSNPRSNSLTVDGISQNDDFGLNYGGYPTEQPPVSLDAIEQISVDVSPFSAKKGNFGGGTINAVTKSGTNEFKFSGYYEISTPSMAGDVDSISQIYDDGRPVLDEDGNRTFETSQVEPIETQQRFGFNIGGALIEDKLFYFVNYTNWYKKLEMDYGFEGSGATNEYDTSEANYNEFLGILNTTYGIEDSLGGDPKDTNETLLAKLSWNINDSHRLDFTYQWQDDNDARNFGTGGSTVDLASSRYTYASGLSNFATKIYSDWNDNFTTELGISYKDVSSDSITNSDLGSVLVEEYYRGPGYQFGRDPFRHANKSETQNFILSLDATYLLGEHEINFGGQYERLRLYNLFAQNSRGSWEYDNFEGFENGEVGNFRGEYDFTYDNAYTNDANDTAYDAVRSQISLYIEDTFYLSDDVEMIAGIRYERLSSDDKPMLNPAFEETYGFTNQENLDGVDIILPRLGITWFATEDLTVRGGVGRFQGGIPNVWYNNPFQNDGITLVSAPKSVIDDYYANNSADFTQGVPQAIQDSMTKGAGSTNYTDPNFKLPSSWRAQTGFDLMFDIPSLGDQFKWSAEIMYHMKENEAVWKNTAIRPIGLAADGERIINESIYSGDLEDNFDIMMTNAEDDGRGIILSTALAKQWNNGIGMTMSYAYQDITENQAGSSSRAQSNYQHNIIKNRNVDMVANGYYEVEHSFKMTFSYHTELFAGHTTRLDMFLESRSGRPYSTVMGMYNDGDLGDTDDFDSSSGYLAYIPSGADDPNVNWDESGLSWDELSVLMDQAGIAASGSIMDRNTGTQPWVTTVDLSIKQEIPGFAKGHKGQVYLMIENFANMLNDDWGIEKTLRYPNQALYDFGGLDDQGRYIIDARHNGADTRNYSQVVTSSSSWQMKAGISYKF